MVRPSQAGAVDLSVIRGIVKRVNLGQVKALSQALLGENRGAWSAAAQYGAKRHPEDKYLSGLLTKKVYKMVVKELKDNGGVGVARGKLAIEDAKGTKAKGKSHKNKAQEKGKKVMGPSNKKTKLKKTKKGPAAPGGSKSKKGGKAAPQAAAAAWAGATSSSGASPATNKARAATSMKTEHPTTLAMPRALAPSLPKIKQKASGVTAVAAPLPTNRASVVVAAAAPPVAEAAAAAQKQKARTPLETTPTKLLIVQTTGLKGLTRRERKEPEFSRETIRSLTAKATSNGAWRTSMQFGDRKFPEDKRAAQLVGRKIYKVITKERAWREAKAVAPAVKDAKAKRKPIARIKDAPKSR